MVKRCESCNIDFIPKHPKKNRFCSRGCLYESMRTRKVCEQCGARLVSPNRKTARYCSANCRVQGSVKGPDWERKRFLNWYYQKEYCISYDEYELLWQSQNGRCKICGEPETATNKNGKPYRLAVDHDHITGKVRGLLCRKHNQMIGMANDNPLVLETAAKYLRGED